MRFLVAFLASFALLVSPPAVTGEHRVVPSFEVITPEGEAVMLAEVLGPATVVFFWTTWCGYCRQELVELQRIAETDDPRGLGVVAVNLDPPGSSLQAFLRRLGVSLPVYTVRPATARTLGIETVPLTLLVDGRGRIIHQFVGYLPEELVRVRSLARDLLSRQDGGVPPRGE
jgi:thiol-disulfide isomerase/thioredoxin